MIYKVLFWIWFGVILFLSFVSKTPKNKIEIGNILFRLDYLEHLVVYFLLGFLFIMCQRKHVSMNIIIYIILGIAWASLTEVVQLFIKGRTFNPVDLIYNTVGITLGLYITWLISKRKYSENKVSI